jgi:predicted RNA-binding protein associated with RNAse of E/G family
VRRFGRGEPVALRELWDERIFEAIPARIVDDRGDRRTFYIGPCISKSARGTNGDWLRLPVGDWTLEDHPSRNHLLSFSFDGVAAATLLIWSAEWEPRHWYVNLETPPRRTSIGFDYTDHALDVLVSIDRTTVTWKDEDELDEAVGRGLFTREDAATFRRDGERAVEKLVNRESPFDQDWTDWRADPSWTAPELPAGWDRLGDARLPRESANRRAEAR